MDNNASSLNGQNLLSQSLAQRRFYQWVLKWINGFNRNLEFGNEESRDIRNSAKPDVPTLACLLQAIGFKLLSFENRNDDRAQKKDENDSSTLKVTIECGASSMKAVLELGDVLCRCPNSDHVKDASFWSISGTAPTGSTDNIMQKVEETGSNLIPRLPKDITKVLHDVSYKLFEIITFEPDVNRNTSSSNTSRLSTSSYDSKIKPKIMKEIGVVRSYTQPEIRMNSLNSKCLSEVEERSGNDSLISVHQNLSPAQSKKPTLDRQKTYDMETGSFYGEPRPSPPKITSSPSLITELSTSLGQLSLQDEIENHQNLADYIIGAQQILEKALKMLSLKKQTIACDLSFNQDRDEASVKSAPAYIFPATSPTDFTTIANVKLMPKSSHVTQKQQSVKSQTGSAAAPLSKSRRSVVPVMPVVPVLPKSNAQKGMRNDLAGPSPKFRRRSFYLPSSTNSNLSLLTKPSNVGQKLLGNGKYGATKINVGLESDSANRAHTSTTKLISPEPRTNVTSNLETVNASKTRTPSMIKPPTKISKSLSVKIKPVQSSKTDSGKVTKKSKMSVSKE